MPDDVNNAPETNPTAEPKAQAPAPAAPSLPPDVIQVPKAEWERLSQSKGIVEAATRHGFKSAKDFDRYSPAVSAIRERGLDPRMLADLLIAKSPDSDDHGDPGDVDNRFTKFQQHIERMALDEYENLTRAEKASVKALAKEIAGENADPLVISLAEKALLYDAAMARQDYGDGHVLKGRHFRPLDSDGVAGLRKPYDELRARAQGQSKAALADAASKKAPSSPPAGRSTGQGAPTDTDSKKNTVPFSKLPREQQLAESKKVIDRMRQQTGRQPIASTV